MEQRTMGSRRQDEEGGRDRLVGRSGRGRGKARTRAGRTAQIGHVCSCFGQPAWRGSVGNATAPFLFSSSPDRLPSSLLRPPRPPSLDARPSSHPYLPLSFSFQLFLSNGSPAGRPLSLLIPYDEDHQARSSLSQSPSHPPYPCPTRTLIFLFFLFFSLSGHPRPFRNINCIPPTHDPQAVFPLFPKLVHNVRPCPHLPLTSLAYFLPRFLPPAMRQHSTLRR